MYLFVYCLDRISTCTCIGRSVLYFCTCTVGNVFVLVLEGLYLYLYWRGCVCTCTGGGMFVNVPGGVYIVLVLVMEGLHLVLGEVDLYLYL